MQEQIIPTFILSEKGLLIMIESILGLGALVLMGFAVILKTKQDIVDRFQGTRIMDYVVLIIVSFIILVLGIQRVLASEAIATIIGSMIGYIVGARRHISHTGKEC